MQPLGLAFCASAVDRKEKRTKAPEKNIPRHVFIALRMTTTLPITRAGRKRTE